MTSWEKIRRGWESRFPDLDEDWTHWWIEGDDNFLVLIDGCNLSEAIEFIMETCEQYASIKAYRAKFNKEGKPTRETKRSYEITDKSKESRPPFPNDEERKDLIIQFNECGKSPRQ